MSNPYSDRIAKGLNGNIARFDNSPMYTVDNVNSSLQKGYPNGSPMNNGNTMGQMGIGVSPSFNANQGQFNPFMNVNVNANANVNINMNTPKNQNQLHNFSNGVANHLNYLNQNGMKIGNQNGY